ncbi:MAG: hypothetical protein ACYC1S_13665 [Gemmatimonadaceae bacterium]
MLANAVEVGLLGPPNSARAKYELRIAAPPWHPTTTLATTYGD